ncbi:atherin-like [Pseudoliparis swirei]|uniref:atherin-like n=1 Tax=Pseudoliparis swirei TaxID=2059687 RepID=UPI0024BE789B|nr:atherin-like [Pseudoliparis swirei]
MSNTGPSGSLDQDRFLRAMLQLRNTPDPDCNLSPAQIIFGRPLRGSLSFVNRLEKFSNPHIRLLWRDAWAAKEDALRTRMSRTTESLGTHSRPLRPLALGERVFLQNQQGPSPHKWDRSGIVVESLSHDQYRVRVDGSGRLTLRNRRFLRAYTPATPHAHQQSAAPPPPPTAQEHRPPPIHPGWAAPQGVAQPPADGPRDWAVGASPPAPVDEATADLTVPAGAVLGAPLPVPQSPPTLPQPTRPGRARRPPSRYEPESGSWIRDLDR